MYLITALSAFFKILFNKTRKELWEKEIALLKEPAQIAAAPIEKENQFADAIYTLVLLQRDGRLIDFLMENINGYSNEQIGAAVRQVHSGCRKTIEQYFPLEPVSTEPEGENITIKTGFNPNEYELTGKISGEPPYKGLLRHKGWKVTKVNLPIRKAGRSPEIVCPAEVEVN